MIYILIPVYNEADNIPNLFVELSEVLPDEEKFLVFSDDGSTDGSRELLRATFRNWQHEVLGDGVNRGPGAAFNAGFEYILAKAERSTDLVLTLEADTTSDLALLPTMLGCQRLGFDLVLASVYAQGGGFSETTFFRKLISNLANLMCRFLFDIKVLTISSFYRLYTVDLLRRIKKTDGQIITEKGFICMLEVLVKAVRAHASIIEVPMVLDSRKRKGKSKMKVIKTSLEYLRFFTKIRRLKSPESKRQ